jgi:hypothetical protein
VIRRHGNRRGDRGVSNRGFEQRVRGEHAAIAQRWGRCRCSEARNAWADTVRALHGSRTACCTPFGASWPAHGRSIDEAIRRPSPCRHGPCCAPRWAASMCLACVVRHGLRGGIHARWIGEARGVVVPVGFLELPRRDRTGPRQQGRRQQGGNSEGALRWFRRLHRRIPRKHDANFHRDRAMPPPGGTGGRA